MRVVIDTNVLISAIFFKGKPAVILDAWRIGKLEIALSADSKHYKIGEKDLILIKD